ncbi:MAG: hypothetical protein A2W91_13700 [Bacteroidetes bacterium GWF2_38_335]|nr:MAG: hypothetical protein A2W91_13700 [Bacteroidetes bacterium GWF2_38_335]OFY77771.1 MAG: hypothetical protein A2281_15390 [Bacteroidetes bacterium RIFOXYA12_FULL_38_20]HBS87425.1 hypothetical protein [Bacteroidales bacterium]
MFSALLLASCGGSGKEENKGSACKTGNGIEISCEDGEAYKKLTDLTGKFELTFPENKEGYNKFIEVNEPILKEIEPLWASIENIMKADPKLMKQQPYSKTMDYRAKVEMYKSVLSDLDKISVTGAQEGGKFIISIKNGASKDVKEFRGHLQYLDAAGSVVCENDYELSASTLELENGIPAGFEGKTEKGIYCKNTGKVKSVKFEIQGLDYFEK